MQFLKLALNGNVSCTKYYTLTQMQKRAVRRRLDQAERY